MLFQVWNLDIWCTQVHSAWCTGYRGFLMSTGPGHWANPHGKAILSGSDCWSSHSSAPESQVFWHTQPQLVRQTSLPRHWMSFSKSCSSTSISQATHLSSQSKFVYVANGHDAVTSFLGLCSYCCACPVFHNYAIAGSLWTPANKSRVIQQIWHKRNPAMRFVHSRFYCLALVFSAHTIFSCYAMVIFIVYPE